MIQSTSPSGKRVYGTALVCRIWKISRATIYRHGSAARAASDVAQTCRRRGPIGACGDQDLLVHINAEIETSPFQGEGYRKIWARLRFNGVRTAARRVRRVMKANGLLAPHPVDHRALRDQGEYPMYHRIGSAITPPEGRLSPTRLTYPPSWGVEDV
jgi:hypothetical protein